MIRRLALALVFTLGFAVSGLFAASQPAPTLVLQGTLTRADYQTYRLLPFRVPPGTRRVTVELRYTGHKQRTVIDLACFDESRFRGSSGGKSQFTISATDATPSYLPGPIHPGISQTAAGNSEGLGTATGTAGSWFTLCSRQHCTGWKACYPSAYGSTPGFLRRLHLAKP